MLWALSLSLIEGKHFIWPKHNIFTFFMILFSSVYLSVKFSCELWNRKWKINIFLFKILTNISHTAVVPDGNWGSWSDYSGCSVTCGSGIRTRKRHCNNPPKAGNGTYCSIDGSSSIEAIPCNLSSCPSGDKLADFIKRSSRYQIFLQRQPKYSLTFKVIFNKIIMLSLSCGHLGKNQSSFPHICGQSFKHFTLVNYNSRVVPDLKIPHIMTLES